MTAVYGASTAKRRSTKAELDALHVAICTAVWAESPITLRGVFYRVVSAGAVEKTELGYRQVGRELLKLRREGVIDYDDITDGTRWTFRPHTWSGVDAALRDAASSYRRALWTDSPEEVQVYSEKDAITSVIQPVTDEWDVPLGIVRGYSSETFCWQVAQSIRAAGERGKHTVRIYQLGDHDPSGLDAWRSFTHKVLGFLSDDLDVGGIEEDGSDTLAPLWGGDLWIEFRRLAVTPWQITEYSLPTRPTKASDSRSSSFEGRSVEVDALPPTALRQIVEHAITRHLDTEGLRLTLEAEKSEKEILTRIAGGQP
jgi:hypothetical protein